MAMYSSKEGGFFSFSMIPRRELVPASRFSIVAVALGGDNSDYIRLRLRPSTSPLLPLVFSDDSSASRQDLIPSLEYIHTPYFPPPTPMRTRQP